MADYDDLRDWAAGEGRTQGFIDICYNQPWISFSAESARKLAIPQEPFPGNVSCASLQLH